MASLAQRFWKAGNAAAVWMYRRTGGKVGGRAKGGSLVLLLTVAGRKSGLPHTVPVAYVERDGDYYLAATAGGQPKEPQWIRNLRAASTATIEVGRDSRPMSVEVLRGAESDAAWKDVIVATYPSFGPYEAKSGRKIAVARLTPHGVTVPTRRPVSRCGLPPTTTGTVRGEQESMGRSGSRRLSLLRCGPADPAGRSCRRGTSSPQLAPRPAS